MRSCASKLLSQPPVDTPLPQAGEDRLSSANSPPGLPHPLSPGRDSENEFDERVGISLRQLKIAAVALCKPQGWGWPFWGAPLKGGGGRGKSRGLGDQVRLHSYLTPSLWSLLRLYVSPRHHSAYFGACCGC